MRHNNNNIKKITNDLEPIIKGTIRKWQWHEASSGCINYYNSGVSSVDVASFVVIAYAFSWCASISSAFCLSA